MRRWLGPGSGVIVFTLIVMHIVILYSIYIIHYQIPGGEMVID